MCRYTFKALGAGFYGLRSAKSFRDTILEVIMQAGDADRYWLYCCKVEVTLLSVSFYY